MTLPVLELLTDADPRVPDGLVELLTIARSWCDPRAPDRRLGEPAARLATSPGARGLDEALRSPVPLAVVVDGGHVLADDVARRADVLVVRSARDAAELGAQALVLPRESVDTAAHPPLSPFVRERRRTALRLPAEVVLSLGFDPPTPVPGALTAAALAVASAAAVRGPNLVVALALGTPTVTTAAEAARVGARDGEDVIVADESAAVSTARLLAEDRITAASVSVGARLLAERAWDRRKVARSLVDRLGLTDPSVGAPLARLSETLDALGTPAGAPQAIRALSRVTTLTGARDWTQLTGRRR